MWPFGWLAQKWVGMLSDRQVERRYINAGRIFGEAASYFYVGECIGFTDILAAWARWEKEYARRGYRTLSVDIFIKFGGWGVPLKGLGTRRTPDEETVLHAEIYRQLFLDQISPVIDSSNPTVPQTGRYTLPRTELPKAKPPPHC